LAAPALSGAATSPPRRPATIERRMPSTVSPGRRRAPVGGIRAVMRFTTPFFPHRPNTFPTSSTDGNRQAAEPGTSRSRQSVGVPKADPAPKPSSWAGFADGVAVILPAFTRGLTGPKRRIPWKPARSPNRAAVRRRRHDGPLDVHPFARRQPLERRARTGLVRRLFSTKPGGEITAFDARLATPSEIVVLPPMGDWLTLAFITSDRPHARRLERTPPERTEGPLWSSAARSIPPPYGLGRRRRTRIAFVQRRGGSGTRLGYDNDHRTDEAIGPVLESRTTVFSLTLWKPSGTGPALTPGRGLPPDPPTRPRSAASRSDGADWVGTHDGPAWSPEFPRSNCVQMRSTAPGMGTAMTFPPRP